MKGGLPAISKDYSDFKSLEIFKHPLTNLECENNILWVMNLTYLFKGSVAEVFKKGY